MRRLQGVFVCLAVALNILVAQSWKPGGDPRLPFAMQQAFARIAKGEATTPEMRRIAVMLPPASPPTRHVCSVPLLQMPIDTPEQFTIRLAPAPKNDPMPRAVVPAPPCEKNNR
ncbi:MAG: hypothetical protein ACR2NN_28575 [Bryobacteraceae bacterium]